MGSVILLNMSFAMWLGFIQVNVPVICVSWVECPLPFPIISLLLKLLLCYVMTSVLLINDDKKIGEEWGCSIFYSSLCMCFPVMFTALYWFMGLIPFKWLLRMIIHVISIDLEFIYSTIIRCVKNPCPFNLCHAWVGITTKSNAIEKYIFELGRSITHIRLLRPPSPNTHTHTRLLRHKHKRETESEV